MQTFLNRPDEMDWLFEVHLKGRTDRVKWESAVIFGNEDCPKKVVVYQSANPKVTDDGKVVVDNYQPII